MPSLLAAHVARLDFLYRDRPFFAGMKARLLAAFDFLLLVFVPLNIGKLLWVQPPELGVRLLFNLLFALAALGSLIWLHKGRQELAGNWLVLGSTIPIHLVTLIVPAYAEPLTVAIQLFAFDLIILLLALVFTSRRMAFSILVVIVASHLAFYGKALRNDPLAGSMNFAADTMMRDGLITIGFLFCLGITLVTMIEEAYRRSEESLQATRALNENLEKLVSDRTRDLEEATRRATEASQAKGDFLANMSHEIRTPLHGIVASSELLLHRDDLPPEAAAQMNLIAESGDLLLRVLGDVLDFSKIEAGQLELETHRFELEPLIAGTAAMVATKAEQGNVHLSVEVDPALQKTFIGDSFRLRQILLNLLTNAIKFTPQQGLVKITVNSPDPQKNPTRIRFAVSDTGIGMDKRARERIFERFAQAHTATSRLYGGTGLGLAISERLTRIMGGNLEVDSEPGRGSVFHFTISLQATEGGMSRPTGEEDLGLPLGVRVLVAEDNAINRKILGAQLEKLGCQHMMVCDGHQALAALQQGPLPDVVLMDCDMPGLDGWETTRRLRAWAKEPNASPHVLQAAALPVIALTAATLPEERQRCFAAGMNDYLSKPLKLDSLARLLAPHVRKS